LKRGLQNTNKLENLDIKKILKVSITCLYLKCLKCNQNFLNSNNKNEYNLLKDVENSFSILNIKSVLRLKASFLLIK
jgi:hypothetical protein